MTGREHLNFYGRVKGIRANDLSSTVAEMIHDVGLSEFADRMAHTYSGGNKRKLSLACALIGRLCSENTPQHSFPSDLLDVGLEICKQVHLKYAFWTSRALEWTQSLDGRCGTLC